ncbi:tRNA (guanine-N7-)-methyltransferase [Methylosinus sp. sav-2]|uniref:tRNA (guanosine(46)-N7)-methyltransferase TrmB n=1 Tax=unclassified Methylosinus TaxID=2624500 RepID=UPI0004AD2AF9|nr:MULTISPECIES: tRNA (guanosine(46)-N7)-methyltransferase TrmB [unclassified Methylosinus]TDX63114.1 tRNA (guanine-N7-)-methyltransferase [Methylosinus sp. sav-2]
MERDGDLEEAIDGGAAHVARRLYGRSKGKALRAGQARLLQDLLPRLTLDLSQPCPSAAGLFPTAVAEVRLEIGFGGGEHLIAAAAARPDVGFIGCEPFVNGMAKLLARIDALGLANIRLHQGDAAEVIGWLPKASLGRTYLFYPDPWPKRRHRKRRFVSKETLEALAHVLRPGGELRFATDIDDYAGWTLARVRESTDFAWTAAASKDWLTPWQGWTQTKYEAKAMAAGRKPVYLTFMRRGDGASDA